MFHTKMGDILHFFIQFKEQQAYSSKKNIFKNSNFLTNNHTFFFIFSAKILIFPPKFSKISNKISIIQRNYILISILRSYKIPTKWNHKWHLIPSIIFLENLISRAESPSHFLSQSKFNCAQNESILYATDIILYCIYWIYMIKLP